MSKTEFLRFRHVVNLGDLISSLAGVKSLYEKTGVKAAVYQQLNRPGEYFVGAQHPTVDDSGAMVCFNEDMFNMIQPLLLNQDYIAEFEVYTGQPVNYDLDTVRLQTYCGAPNFPLHKWTWMAYPELTCDLSVPWINAHQVSSIEVRDMDGKHFWWQSESDKPHNRIIINFTDRYRNFNINYFFLKEYEKDIVFAGTELEYKKFCENWGLNIKRLVVKDFLELACAIKSCRFFLGNQSFCWHLAESMKVTRILELYPHAQNCTSFGPNGYEFYHQHAVEYFVNKIIQ